VALAERPPSAEHVAGTVGNRLLGLMRARRPEEADALDREVA